MILPDEKMIVAPSVLSADFLNLGDDLRDVEMKGANWHHVDIMDGHYVPNATFGPDFVRQLKAKSQIPLDVHLMISNTDGMFQKYIDAGADHLHVHPDTTFHLHRLLAEIKKQGVKAGVALNPGTSLSVIEEVLPMLDLILVMSVNPGFGGQMFIEETFEKLSRLQKMLKEKRLDKHILVEVDGGVTTLNVGKLKEHGVRAVVAGQAVYKAPNRERAIQDLKV